MSIGVTFNEWIQKIKWDIFQVLAAHKMVYVHRAKTACMCIELNDLLKAINIPKDQSITPNTNNLFRSIQTHVGQLRNLFQSLSETEYLSTLLEHPPNYVINSLNDFRRKFNELIRSLKLADSDPCPINPSQEKVDDSADVQEILIYLNKAEGENTLTNEEQKDILPQRIQEFQELNSKYQHEEEENIQHQTDLRRNLSPEEIEHGLEQFKKWSQDFKDFELQKKIGSGGYAEVYLGYQRSTGKVVAIKRLHSQQFNATAFENFRRELEIFAKLQHFAVLPFVGVCMKPPYCIITEFMSGGCLFNRLHSESEQLDATQLTIIALGVACGMEYIHEMDMVHRDLKSLNILLDADCRPMICDFGMSRLRPSDDSIMTGSVGTTQWAAPEVLNSEKYCEKADVYSYGILLWELLTHDIPFRGLKNVQVALAVINQDSRPLIPQNCPPKLGKLIKICWDKDPNRRPDFKTIVGAFKTGEISFPGTNNDRVQGYISSSMKVMKKVTHFNPKDASKRSVKEIIKGLQDNETIEDALAKLLLVSDQTEWIPYILESNLIETIIDRMKDCSQAQIAFNLVQAIEPFLEVESTLKSFIKLSGTHALLELFIKFGTTTMTKVIDCFSIVIKHDKVILTSEHFQKLAPFLVANDLSVRVSATKLLNLIIEHLAFDTDSSLTVVANNVLSNVIPEAMKELLLESLQLLKNLLDLSSPYSFIIRANGPSNVFVLTSHSDHTIIIESLDLLRQMLINSLPPQKTVNLCVNGFFDLISSNNPNIQMKTLIILAILLKSPYTFKEVALASNTIEAFSLCLKNDSPQVVIYSLRLCFAFLSNPISFTAFSTLSPILLSLLSSDTDSIAQLVASCLTAIIHNNGEQNLLGKEISEYLLKSLNEESSLTMSGLRLAGVISSSFKGARFLEANKIIGCISKLMFSKNAEIMKFSIMVFASHSASYPMSNAAVDSLGHFFESINKPDLAPYPLITISNLTVNPKGAQSCIKYLSQLVDLLNSEDDDSLQRVFSAIHNIVVVPEAINMVTDEKVIISFIKSTEKFWDTDYASIVFDILDSIAGCDIGKAALQESLLPDFLVEKLQTIAITHPMRSIYIRIISRIDVPIS